VSRFHVNNGEYDEWERGEARTAGRVSDPGLPYGYGELDRSDYYDLAPADGPLPSLEETAEAIRRAQARVAYYRSLPEGDN